MIVHFILTFIIQLLHRRDDFSGFIKNGYLASASIFLIVTMWGVVNGDFRKSFVILSIFAATILINLLLYRFLEIQKLKIKTTLYISGVSLALISILSLIYFRQEYSFYREGAATTIGILISLFLLQFLTYIFLRGLSRLANTRNWADKPKYHEHMWGCIPNNLVSSENYTTIHNTKIFDNFIISKFTHNIWLFPCKTLKHK